MAVINLLHSSNLQQNSLSIPYYLRARTPPLFLTVQFIKKFQTMKPPKEIVSSSPSPPSSSTSDVGDQVRQKLIKTRKQPSTSVVVDRVRQKLIKNRNEPAPKPLLDKDSTSSFVPVASIENSDDGVPVFTERVYDEPITSIMLSEDGAFTENRIEGVVPVNEVPEINNIDTSPGLPQTNPLMEVLSTIGVVPEINNIDTSPGLPQTNPLMEVLSTIGVVPVNEVPEINNIDTSPGLPQTNPLMEVLSTIGVVPVDSDTNLEIPEVTNIDTSPGLPHTNPLMEVVSTTDASRFSKEFPSFILGVFRSFEDPSYSLLRGVAEYMEQVAPGIIFAVTKDRDAGRHLLPCAFGRRSYIGIRHEGVTYSFTGLESSRRLIEFICKCLGINMKLLPVPKSFE